jgi:hypothetical protein
MDAGWLSVRSVVIAGVQKPAHFRTNAPQQQFAGSPYRRGECSKIERASKVNLYHSWYFENPWLITRPIEGGADQ